jgi:hypothetical protein
MKPDIDWNEVAKVELRPGVPERPEQAVKAIASYTSPHEPTGKTGRIKGCKPK